MTQQTLAGTHAIITGGSRGIGAAIATALAARGASITLMSRSIDALRARAALMESMGATVQFKDCNVADERSVARAFRDAQSTFGPAGILVNNAGIAKSAKFLETSRAAWDDVMSVNVTGTFLCCQQVLPAMLEAKRGRIVNMSSTAGLRGYRTMSAYCASKHAVIGLTRSLAQETAKHGVTVNAVCPGYTETDLVEDAISNIVRSLGKTREEARAMLVALNPRGVMTSSSEVAEAVAWLCEPAAQAVNGIALPIAGGEVT
ncbi:MAG: SDR family NAD(P)-dependent oxidoreductase [Gemmatimonadaceae bacterium]